MIEYYYRGRFDNSGCNLFVFEYEPNGWGDLVSLDKDFNMSRNRENRFGISKSANWTTDPIEAIFDCIRHKNHGDL
jgi:hypothetical protein